MSDRQKLILGFGLGLLGLFLWNLYYDSYEKLYTVGTVEKKQTGLKSGTIAKFIYFYMGEKYEGGTGIGEYKIRIGDRYIVEFGKYKPDLSEALFHYPIPDSLEIDIQEDGWQSIPNEVKRYRIKRTELFGFYDKFFGD